MMRKILNSNIEFLNNIETQNSNDQNMQVLNLEHLNFGFV